MEPFETFLFLQKKLTAWFEAIVTQSIVAHEKYFFG